jgi:hypothetical protein
MNPGAPLNIVLSFLKMGLLEDHLRKRTHNRPKMDVVRAGITHSFNPHPTV